MFAEASKPSKPFLGYSSRESPRAADRGAVAHAFDGDAVMQPLVALPNGESDTGVGEDLATQFLPFSPWTIPAF